jgi:hypothetical protein
MGTYASECIGHAGRLSEIGGEREAAKQHTTTNHDKRGGQTMYFENRFPESGSGQILHPVRAGQNILDLIRRPRIATILLCVDHAAAVTVQTSNHDTLSRKLRESEKGSDGLYRFKYKSYTQDGSGGMHGNITSITLDCDAQFYALFGITVG